LERLKGKDVNFVIDTTGELLMNSLKYRPFLIKPNHHELGDMFGTITETDEDIIKYSRKLQEKGAKNVLVSRAGDGAMLIDENGGVHKIGTAEGTLVSSVGCGDSMVGGFIAGYIEKSDYEYALKLGSACGSATAFTAGLATKNDIESVFNGLK
jgi:1-phosphofructokinase